MCRTKGAKDYQVRDADTLRATVRWTAVSSPGPVVGGDQIRHHRHGTAVGRTPRPGARRGRAGRHPRY